MLRRKRLCCSCCEFVSDSWNCATASLDISRGHGHSDPFILKDDPRDRFQKEKQSCLCFRSFRSAFGILVRLSFTDNDDYSKSHHKKVSSMTLSILLFLFRTHSNRVNRELMMGVIESLQNKIVEEEQKKSDEEGDGTQEKWGDKDADCR